MSLRIKKQGGTHTVIRNTYDPVKGKGVDETIGSLIPGKFALSEENAQKLTVEEQRLLSEKISVLLERSQYEQHRATLAQAVPSLQSIATALRKHARFTGDGGQEVLAALDDLKLAMREAGYKKPRVARVQNDAETAPAAPAALGANEQSRSRKSR